MITPSTENYTLGRGAVYFNKKTDAGYLGERDLGNVVDFNMSVDVETLEHFTSRSGLKSKDKKITLAINPKISFTLDEINEDNVALSSLGEKETVTQAAGTAVSAALTDVQQGHYYDLGKRNVSGAAIATYTEDEDFSIDAVTGRVYIIPGGGIADDSDVTVTFDCAETTYTRIKAMTQSEVEGFLRFVSDNPVGNNMELKIWRVSLMPSGDSAQISDGWKTLAFEGEVLSDKESHADMPYMEIIM